MPASDLLQKRLGAGFAGLAVVTWMLLVFGSTVRVHGAGLSCPDWPLCFGELVPVFNFQVFLEWGHRVLAGTISVGFLALGVAVLANPERRRKHGAIVLAASIVLVAQIVLGGLTVLHLLAFWSVTLHLLFGNAFMALLVVLAVRLRGAAPVALGAARGAAIAVAVAVVVQMALGGLVSSNYAGLACTEWPTCSDGVWFPSLDGIVGLHLLHRLGAYTVLAAAVAFAWTGRASGGAAAAFAVLGLVLAQVTFGVATVLLSMPVELQILHAAMAHLLVATLAWVHAR